MNGSRVGYIASSTSTTGTNILVLKCSNGSGMDIQVGDTSFIQTCTGGTSSGTSSSGTSGGTSSGGSTSSGGTTPTTPSSNRVYVNPLTQCVGLTYDAKPSTNAQWFTISNKCSSTIRTSWCQKPIGATGCFPFTLSATIAGGGSDRSWYLNTKYSGIQIGACPETVNGKNVYIEAESLSRYSCYYFN